MDLAASTTAVFFDLASTNLTLPNGLNDYEAQALAYTLQGLVNRGDTPALFFDTKTLNVDFPASDVVWKQWMQEEKNVTWVDNLTPSLCTLVDHFSAQIKGAVYYPSDGFSIYPALTLSGLESMVPVSAGLTERFPCLKIITRRDNTLVQKSFTTNLEGRSLLTART